MAEKTLFVRTDGDDRNDGLADTPDRALRTIQAAINELVKRRGDR